MNRLISRRDLALKKAEIEAAMNEKLIASVMSQNLIAEPDMAVTASRIASQDEGHTILLKKRSSKDCVDEFRDRLNL